jgi:hypothetical protein
MQDKIKKPQTQRRAVYEKGMRRTGHPPVQRALSAMSRTDTPANEFSSGDEAPYHALAMTQPCVDPDEGDDVLEPIGRSQLCHP